MRETTGFDILHPFPQCQLHKLSPTPSEAGGRRRKPFSYNLGNFPIIGEGYNRARKSRIRLVSLSLSTSSCAGGGSGIVEKEERQEQGLPSRPTAPVRSGPSLPPTPLSPETKSSAGSSPIFRRGQSSAEGQVTKQASQPQSPPLLSGRTQPPLSSSTSALSPASPHRPLQSLRWDEEGRVLAVLEGLARRRRRDEFCAAIGRMGFGKREKGKGKPRVAAVNIHRVEEEGSLEVLEAFIRAAAACQEPRVAWGAMEVMLRRLDGAGEEKAWSPRWDTFSTLMNSLRRGKELDLLLRSFKTALRFRGLSKTVLLNILLAGLCDKNKHVDVAAFYLETAQAKWGVTPNEVSWNTLLGAAARQSQGRLFEDLERKMAAQGLEGDVTTRNIRLQYLLASRPSDGLALFERMRQEARAQGRAVAGRGAEGGRVMDLRTVNIMAGYLARTKGFDEAQAMVEDVRRGAPGIEPRAVTHNILLDALLKARRVEEALEYFYAVAAEASSAGPGPDKSARRGSRGERGRQGGGWRKEREKEVALVDSTTYDILLNGLVQNGRVSTAGAVHTMMRKAQFPPTMYTYAALIRLQKSALDVYRLWGQARAEYPRLSLPFLNLLVYELGQSHNDLPGALAAFRAILRMGRQPNTISFNSLFSALMKDANACLPRWTPPLEEGGEEGPDKTGERLSHGQGYLLEDEYPAVSALSSEGRGLISLLESLQDRTLLEASLVVLRSMYHEGKRPSSSKETREGSETGNENMLQGYELGQGRASSPPSVTASARPNARTFTILMAGINRADLGPRGTALCIALYHEAQEDGVSPNGIMCHALLRSFGPDAKGALGFFKRELRVSLKALDAVDRAEEAARGLEDETEDGREIDGVFTSGGNLSLAYMALLYICGVSGRSDLALQLLYAMQRDGLPTDQNVWEAFEAGKTAPGAAATATSSMGQLWMGPYESLLRTETMGLGWETGVRRVRIKF